METIKSALGLTKQEQSGQEPVSGQQGAGDAVEPYDKGNAVEDPDLGGKAPQETEPTTSTAAVAGTTTDSSKPSASATEPATTSSTIQETAPTTTHGASADSQPAKTGGIGSSSWFSSAIPFIGGKKEPATQEEPAVDNKAAVADTGAGVGAGTAAAATSSVDEHKNLPPNHLPSSVPEGQSTDLETPAATGTSNPLAAAALSSAPTGTEANTEPSATTSAAGTTSNAVPETSDSLPGASGPRASELPGTHTKQTEPTPSHSEASQEKHRENPSAIPVAGGKKLGEAAEEERKASGIGERSSIPTADTTSAAAPAATGAGASSSTPATGETVGKSSLASDRSAASGDAPAEGKEGKKHRNPLAKLKEKLKH